MYFIENKEELIGKTIACVSMNRFAERILIATTDGGILTVTQYSDDIIFSVCFIINGNF